MPAVQLSSLGDLAQTYYWARNGSLSSRPLQPPRPGHVTTTGNYFRPLSDGERHNKPSKELIITLVFALIASFVISGLPNLPRYARNPGLEAAGHNVNTTDSNKSTVPSTQGCGEAVVPVETFKTIFSYDCRAREQYRMIRVSLSHHLFALLPLPMFIK